MTSPTYKKRRIAPVYASETRVGHSNRCDDLRQYPNLSRAANHAEPDGDGDHSAITPETDR